MSYKKPNLKTKYYHDFVSKIKDQSGKFFAITGTTTGTGYCAALAVGQKGGTVLLLNRESERSKKSFSMLKSKNPNANYINIECDLLSFQSVNETAEKIGEARIVNHSSTARKIMKRLEGKYLEKKSGSLGGMDL